VAPPLVKGSELVRRRVAGVVFLIVIALIVELAIALYQKKFTDTVDVSLTTDRAGNQLTVHADVKVRGVLIGEVRKITSRGDGARLELALDPNQVTSFPRNVTAQLVPKTLFGEKQVALTLPSVPSGGHLRSGDIVAQDTSVAAIETEKALDDALPLLVTLKPAQLSLTLNAISEALRGRGDRLGANLALNAAYFRKLNPSLPTLAKDMAGLATVSQNYADTTPDLIRTLDNLSASSRSLVQERKDLDAFLASTADFAATTQGVLAQNEKRLVDLAALSKPTAQLFARYSGNYRCLLNRVAFSEIEGERTFGGAQPGLHITLEVTQDRGGYAQGDEPKNLEDRTAYCFGLGTKAIIPFKNYANPQDGYRDSDPPEDPGTAPPGCCHPPPAQAARWLNPLLAQPGAEVVRMVPLPRGTTPFAALMISPMAGFGL
jgi:phospholipid/cholesterol/gamma-HCH transport system substrate-binding protein